MKHQWLRLKVLGCLMVFFITSAHGATREAEPTWQWVGEHCELLHCIRCLLHVYPILKMDSVNVLELQQAAVCAGLLNLAAFKYILFRTPSNNYCFFVRTTADGPLATGYTIGMIYDAIRYFDAPHLALIHEYERERLQPRYLNCKMQQGIKLLFELALRMLACSIALTKEGNGKDMLPGINFVADWLEVWRLVTRFDTYLQQFNREIKIDCAFAITDTGDFDIYKTRILCVDEENRRVEMKLIDKELEEDATQEYITAGQHQDDENVPAGCVS